MTDAPGWFGSFGGKYVAETLMPALEELELAYRAAIDDPSFRAELERILTTYVGRPTPLYHAKKLGDAVGLDVWLKREDLCHTGAHKINNTVGQVMLARRMGKRRVIAETGAGQHGVATATACALLGLECAIFMGRKDVQRQAPNVDRMKLLGASVREVDAGSATLKDAMNEAIREWVTEVETTYYCIGSVAGPHPYPTMVRDFQAIIGREAREQMERALGGLPALVIACVGGGSNAMGIFHAFRDDDVALVGVEAGGEGLGTNRHAATLTKGDVGVLHGSKSFVLQDAHGQVLEAHSISAGLDYPGVGPEHAYLKSIGRARYIAVDDRKALDGFALLARTEGILAALESSHAIGALADLAGEIGRGARALICLSGRGDKDLATIAARLSVTGGEGES